MSLRLRLLISFILVSIPPILLLGIVSIRITTNIITDITSESTNRMIEQTASELEGLFEEAISITRVFAEDPFIQGGLRATFNSISERYAMDLHADSELFFISEYKKEIFGVYVIGENRAVFKSNPRSVLDGDLRATEWYKQIINSDGLLWFPPHKGSFVVKTVGEPYVTVGMPVIDKNTGKRVGVITADLAEERILELLSERLGTSGSLFLDYSSGFIADHNEIKTIEPLIGPSGKLRDTRGRWILMTRDLMVPGWSLKGVIDVEELTGESRIITLILVIMLIVVAALYLLFAFLISGSVAGPVKKLMHLMREAQEGNFSVHMDVRYKDEIGALGNSFNVMIGKINELMDNVSKEHTKLIKSELKALQAQINPHFLYNTLDSIIGLSMENRREEVIQMVTALTKLFRIGISRGDDIITIREELRHVESYLTIQHTRYKNKFTYTIDVQESVLDLFTVKLILQPVVENAIYHGIKMDRKKGEIRITGCERGDSVYFTVTDTGPGIPGDKLKALNNLMDAADSGEIQSYGLKNVQERIIIHFGPAYGLSFESGKTAGTVVTIKIPQLTEEEKNVKSTPGR